MDLKNHFEIYGKIEKIEYKDGNGFGFVTFKELQSLELEYPDFICIDSPTKRVGSVPLDKFDQVKHRIPLLSLSNAMISHELELFNTQMENPKSFLSSQNKNFLPKNWDFNKFNICYYVSSEDEYESIVKKKNDSIFKKISR